MISIRLSASTLRGSSRRPPPPAPLIFGPAPPTLDVVKNTGSKCAKSPSACIRSIRTEPTIPRQPTRPTRFTGHAHYLQLRFSLLLCIVIAKRKNDHGQKSDKPTEGSVRRK